MPTVPRETSVPADHYGLTFVALVDLVARHRRALVGGLVAGAALGLAGASLRAPRYTASASFTPQALSDQSRAGLAGLAGSIGVNIGGLGSPSQSPQFYAELLRTRDVLGPLLADTVRPAAGEAARALADLLDVDEDAPALQREKLLQLLREKLVLTDVATRTGVVTVRVTTRWPDVSFRVLERLLEETNRYNLRSRQTQAAAERRFSERRLAEAQRELRDAEDRAQRFLMVNRTYQGSPELRFDYERLQREVGLRQQLVSSLAQAYEEARIREVRDTPAIAIVESPAVPARADSRRRGLFAAAGGVLGALLAFGVALARGVLRDARDRVPGTLGGAVPTGVAALGD